ADAGAPCLEQADHLAQDREGVAKQLALIRAPTLNNLDTLFDALNALFPYSGHGVNAPILYSLFEVGDALDAEGLVKEHGLLRTDVRNLGEGDKRGRYLSYEAVIEAELARGHKLINFVADGFADAWQVVDAPLPPHAL